MLEWEENMSSNLTKIHHQEHMILIKLTFTLNLKVGQLTLMLKLHLTEDQKKIIQELGTMMDILINSDLKLPIKWTLDLICF